MSVKRSVTVPLGSSTMCVQSMTVSLRPLMACYHLKTRPHVQAEVEKVMGLVSKDDGWQIPDELSAEMERLLPDGRDIRSAATSRACHTRRNERDPFRPA